MRKRSKWPRRVLGIDPGIRYLGTAVIEGEDLVHHAVFDISAETTRGRCNEASRVLSRLIEAYEPELMVIEKTFFKRGRRSSALKLVSEALLATARQHGLDLYEIPPSSLKKETTGNGHASKEEVARSVSQHFPELRAFLGSKRKWQARFHSNMFDAVAAALSGCSRSTASEASDCPGAERGDVRSQNGSQGRRSPKPGRRLIEDRPAGRDQSNAPRPLGRRDGRPTPQA